MFLVGNGLDGQNSICLSFFPDAGYDSILGFYVCSAYVCFHCVEMGH